MALQRYKIFSENTITRRLPPPILDYLTYSFYVVLVVFGAIFVTLQTLI